MGTVWGVERAFGMESLREMESCGRRVWWLISDIISSLWHGIGKVIMVVAFMCFRCCGRD